MIRSANWWPAMPSWALRQRRPSTLERPRAERVAREKMAETAAEDMDAFKARLQKNQDFSTPYRRGTRARPPSCAELSKNEQHSNGKRRLERP